jgi:LPS export ABC transporter protein LptC
MIDFRNIFIAQLQWKTGRQALSFPFYLLLLLGVSLLLSACHEEKDLSKMVTYNGPKMEVNDMETLYSDSARVRVRLTAPKELEMENGDQKFPQGVYIEFYDKDGVKTSTLRSNKGIKKKSENLYNVTGNVVIKNLAKGETLNTEELNWNPTNKKVYTEKFVTIQTPEEILKGEGLDADEDFGHYQIRHVTGTFPLKQ